MRLAKLSLLLFLLSCAVIAADEIVGPWNLTKLKNEVPAVEWLNQKSPVHSLLYVGEPYRGKPNQVFAFYASPATIGKADAKGPFPGVVLIHHPRPTPGSSL